MAQIEGRPTITVSVILKLTEAEAGALDALAGYGIEPFLETFYAKMGKAYLQPYEAGLRSLFDSVLNGPASVKGILGRAKEARQVFNGEKKALSVNDA